MLYTGIDGNKIVSVDYNPFKKNWKISSKIGKKIFVIPSDKVLIKKERTPEGLKERDLKRFLKTKYKNFLFDYTFLGDYYILVLVKDFEPPQDYAALDAEPFSLARLKNLVKSENLQILDLGKRKTTWVLVENGEFQSYRVLNKGGSFLMDALIKNGYSIQEAESILLEEGLNSKILKEEFQKILNNLPLHTNHPLLLSGGLSKLKGIKEFFEEKKFQVMDLNLVEPEKFSALGAALKFVYKDNSPSFKRPEVSPAEIKIFVISLLVIVISFFASAKFLDSLVKDFHLRIKEKEKLLFSQKFPELPPVAVVEQLRTMQKQKKVSILPAMEGLLEKIPEGVKIYEIGFIDGVFYVKGEAPADMLDKIKPTKYKKLENGNILFEIRG